MHTGKFQCIQCKWRFESSEKLKDHVEYLHSENLESSQIIQEELMDSDTENDPMMDSDSEEERNKPSKNKDTKKIV